MRCPKCGHVQTGPGECERCKAVFDSTRMARGRNQKMVKRISQQSEPPPIPVGLTLLFCVVAASGLWYCLFWPAPEGAAGEEDRNTASMQQVKTVKNQSAVSKGRGTVMDETLQATIPCCPGLRLR